MTAPTPNAALAYLVLDHIDAHPELWDQGRYIGAGKCGTVACFAGWACLLSGEQPHFYYPGETSWLADQRRPVSVATRAEELLGASRYSPTAADGDDYDEDLFGASNTREDLGRLVAEIFGPRPEAAS